MRLPIRLILILIMLSLAVSVSGQPAPSKPDPADTKVSMSFDKADVNSVIKFLSGATGVPIVCDPDIKGTVTIVSQKQIPLTDAFEVINAALRVRGFTMVGTLESKVIRVVQLKKAIADKVTVQSGKDPVKIISGDNLVTQVIPLDYASAVKMKDELKPLVAEDQASLVAVASTNTLIITDNAGNVHRVARIISELDKDTSDIVEVEIYQCKHSSADSLVDTLGKIFQISKAGAQPQPQPGRPPEGQPQPQVKSDDGIISLKGEIKVASDTRTNMLIISAAKPKLKLVMDVVDKLDVNTQPEVKSKGFTLQYADAKMVAGQLNKLFEQPQGGIGEERRRFPWDWGGGGSQGGKATDYAGLKRNVVVPDMRTNSVIVTATEQNMKAFEDMIAQLDAPKVLSEITRVFPLKYAKAADLGDTLNRLFRGEYRRRGSFYDFFMGMSDNNNDEGPLAELRNITVVAAESTNTLLVTGPPQAFSMVENMITQLDKRTVQVFIEVAIVDVTLDDATRFGVEWLWTSATKRPDGTPEQTAGVDFGLEKLPSGGLTYRVLSDNLKVLLKALETRSNVKVYSTPTITTADNVEARISIGQEVPYTTSELETNAGNFQRNVDYKDVAVSLTVTPHVNESSDLIALDVLQTINEIIGNEPELNAPIVAKREAQTAIMVKDAQTIVIGGIMKENRSRVSRGIPVLSRIPILGELFKSSEWRKQNSELMVFLTPHILKDDESTSAITEQVKENLAFPPKDGYVGPDAPKQEKK